MKRLPRSLNQLERAVLAAVEKAGRSGLTYAAADGLFNKHFQYERRVAVFEKLRGLGLITPERSVGGATVWKKRKPHEPAPQGNRREPVDPALLRVYLCERWPQLTIRDKVQFR